MIDSGSSLARRLERYRATSASSSPRLHVAGDETELAIRLATALDGELVRTAEGVIVRCEAPARTIAIDRRRLASLPGQPPSHVPLVCLDTETTGLATAAGTVAFLIGLGWWEADRFRQVQLLLPDHADERALLTALAAMIPTRAWLVTYNGRGFDWPLLVARYRLARRAAPLHDGHLDLLPVVRRLFRHRMANARLRTAEAELLGLRRIGDVEGWEIPGRYLAFLRGGSASGLVEVARHNDQDVRSLARLLVLLETRLGDERGRAEAAPGDLAGLARAFVREHRLSAALACLDLALGRLTDDPPSFPGRSAARERIQVDDDPWWSSRRPADLGGRPKAVPSLARTSRIVGFDAPWTAERIAIDRAHVLRRLGRHADAAETWSSLAAGPGRVALLAATELAKLVEHRLGDPAGALVATQRGMAAAERRRRLGHPEPRIEADLTRRAARLRRRLATRKR
jgi:hypothetical protein